MTTISDTFDSSRPINLEEHVATGPHGGFAWRHLRAFEDTVKLVPGEAAIVSPPVSRTYKYLADARLPALDQRVSIDVLDWAVDGRNAQAGVYARVNASLDGYTFKIRSQPTPTFRLRLTERISDDEIEHDLVMVDAVLPHPPFTLSLEVRRTAGGNDLRGLINGQVVIRATDDRLTDGDRTAVSIQGDSGGSHPTRLGNFIARSL